MPRLTQRILMFFSVGLIVYGSLYPFSGWWRPDGGTASLLNGEWPRHISRGDLITNLLAYAPLGYLLCKSLPRRAGWGGLIIVATFLGTLLSVGMESLQMFLPSRVSSLGDVILNGISTLGGALTAWGMGEQTLMGERLLIFRRRWFHPGNLADIGLVVLGLWALSQLAPFVPSLDVGSLKNSLKPLWYTLHDLARFNPHQASTYALNVAGLGVIASLTARDDIEGMKIFATYAAAVLSCKALVVGRQLSLEALAGLVVGLLVAYVLPRRMKPVVAAGAIVAAFVVDELRPVASSRAVLYTFNWIPFRGQMATESGFVGILEGFWPFAALAYLALTTGTRRCFLFASLVGLLLVCGVAGLEWAQRVIPGRYPDITSVLLASVGWGLPWLFQPHDAEDIVPEGIS